MKWTIARKGMTCGLALVFMAGCNTFSGNQMMSEGPINVSPVMAGENEHIIRDQVIVLVDVTGSIGSLSRYEHEKDLVQAFADAMPEGSYASGIDSFAGVTPEAWVNLPLARYNRMAMVDGAASIEPLGATTPLARAIQYQKAEVAGIGGRGALLVFSDGKVTNPDAVLQACRDLKAAHGGEFCIYTVQIGSDREGGQLLRDMAQVNGCGMYYDGETLNSAEAFDALARDVFMGAHAPAPAPAPQAPANLPVSYRNILFDNDKSVIKSSYDTQLEAVTAFMAENPATRIRLDGHTDSNASNAYNQKLSERRVNAVKGALTQRGADPARLLTEAHGEENPTVPNNSPEHLHQNRRVELTVVE